MLDQAGMIVLGVLGGLLVLPGLWLFLRPNILLPWFRGSVALLIILVGGYTALLALDLRHYQTLSDLETVATIGMTKSGPQTWRVRVEQPEQDASTFMVRGDQWQVDARILHLKKPLSWLGIGPLYRLERISGRYARLDQARSAKRTVYGLSGGSWFDSWHLDREHGLPFLDALYGNATFMPMADGAVFDVRLSSTGLAALPANRRAGQAMDDWIMPSDSSSEAGY
ncbi:multidrug transporter [Tamilnaduibacter salinus]|uniref:Multidrug transporter n=1 Tax=Tamilnaduibacter salinus TaxID=1484056 RepID=A0A2A2I4P7_9GAMM|nr:multidrug transporter [Tamilnaduibacter salinus]PAV26368.1 multidrug transporter [Tamilnaduibacter salinus]